MPEKAFRLFGREHSFNPGKFNQKEHMLITIMATVAFNTPCELARARLED